MQTPRVQLRPGSIWIDGRPVYLFTSSLFYFRIPSAEWRGRMQTLKRLGYNAIDAYFPWNYHELEPGKWDFQGERDAAAFLQMAKEEELWVIARPGPYICSEWDGGALPAFLNVDPNLRLRQANPAYLEAARRWYGRILPILAGFQVDRGGTILMMQVENELDFFDCQDRRAMMSALRDMALAEGISAPLIACAGQGYLPGATGGVEGIVPACNVYFADSDPGVEERARYYEALLREQGYPLCIIETNRAHADLRRLVAGGAKLIGPYLQTGGTDFGFTTGVTNWGSPMAFMTSHYDFNGMLSPGGTVRAEGLEARLLIRMLEALGPAAALSRPVNEAPVRVTGNVIPAALALDGGGWLVSLANPGEEAVQVSIGEGAARFPAQTELTVPPKRCPFVLVGLPLAAWGVQGQIAYATAELVGRETLAGGLDLTFVIDGPVEIALLAAGASLGENTGWQTEQAGDLWRFWQNDSQPGWIELRLPGNRRIRLRAVDRETAAGFSLSSINPASPGKLTALDWQVEPLDPCAADWFADARPCDEGRLCLEQNGIYRGYGWYRSGGRGRVPGREPKGLLVHSGADVLSLYAGSSYLGSLVPGGLNAFLPWPSGAPVGPEHPLVVRAEIWGHANFDDGRLPALRLSALRGIAGLTAVTDVENLTSNWFYQDSAQGAAQGAAQDPAGAIDPSWPYLAFGNWSTTREPAHGIYYREARFSNAGDTRLLHFPDLRVDARVYANGIPAGEATPFNPWVDLSRLTRPGETARLAVAVDRRLRGSTGPVILYQGQSIPDWEAAGWGEAEFARLLGRSTEKTVPADLPFRLAPGQMAWLHARIPEAAASTGALDMVFEGQGLKVSTWLGQRLVGRVWLPARIRPRMAGGPDDRVYLPADWIREAGGEVHLLIENVGEEGDGELASAGLAREE